MEEATRADHVEVSLDADKSNWLVRIDSGEEVIRRRYNATKKADDQTIRPAVQATVEDERYELDLVSISIRRHPSFGPNEVRSMDVGADRFADRTRFRWLAVVDIYTRKCLTIESAHRELRGICGRN